MKLCREAFDENENSSVKFFTISRDFPAEVIEVKKQKFCGSNLKF